jgi:hypothetical protein
MTESTTEARPAGCICSGCLQHTPYEWLAGPIIVTFKNPEFPDEDGTTEMFCSWKCLANWAGGQATRS